MTPYCTKKWLFPPSLLWLSLFLFLTTSLLAQAQPKKIQGKVTDDAGQPVPGASVMVKGSRIAVTAGADGAFTILAREKDVLVVSYVGFQDKEIAVSGNNCNHGHQKPCYECWGGSEGLKTCKGEPIGVAPRSVNFRIW